MSDILIVASTAGEAEFLTGKSRKGKEGKIIPVKGKSSHNVHLLITGPGIAATTYYLSKALWANSYKLAINIGICGSLDRQLKPVRLVRVITDQFGDFGADDNGIFRDAFELGFLENNTFPYRDKKLREKCRYRFTCLDALPKVNGITVQQVTGSKKQADSLVRKFGPGIESMEGAAFFYVCLMEKINCMQVRSVSNFVGKRNRDSWKIGEAIDALEGITGMLLMEAELMKL